MKEVVFFGTADRIVARMKNTIKYFFQQNASKHYCIDRKHFIKSYLADQRNFEPLAARNRISRFQDLEARIRGPQLELVHNTVSSQ